MKNGPIIFASSLLLALTAAFTATAHAEKAADDFHNRSVERRRELSELDVQMQRLGVQMQRVSEERALAQCDTSRIVVRVPDLFTAFVAFEWTGACVDGKRDGEGVLTLVHETQGSSVVHTTKSKGRFVKGQRLGLWCGETITGGLATGSEVTEGCQVFAGHANPLSKTLYRKQPDGSWLSTATGPTAVSLPPGSLEAQSAKVLAEGAGKKSVQAPAFARLKLLDGLLPGSRIALEPSLDQNLLKDKRIGVVLSSLSISELERFKRERDALISATAGMTGDAAKYRSEFIAASDPVGLLKKVSTQLLKLAKTVEYMDDLTALKQGKFDYALVIDWDRMTRFDLLGRFGDFPAYPPPQGVSWDSGSSARLSEGVWIPVKAQDPSAVGCYTLGGLLINSDLKAVRYMNGGGACHEKWENEYLNPDGHYLLTLSIFFKRQGSLFDYALKR